MEEDPDSASYGFGAVPHTPYGVVMEMDIPSSFADFCLQYERQLCINTQPSTALMSRKRKFDLLENSPDTKPSST